MRNSLVSIVVPVYNAEKCLRRCVESILSQTCSRWELILVNDGSTDNSALICQEYSRADKRIHTVDKANGGVSSARNLGIESAGGEYITFVDADDFLSPDFLSKLTDNDDSDLAICGFESLEGFRFAPDSFSGSLIGDVRYATGLIENSYYLDTPWCKLFRSEIIRNNEIRFDTRLRLGEDTLFCYTYLKYCRSLKVFSDSLYFYDGVWGGGQKYSLSIDDLSLMSRLFVKALEDIEKGFGVQIDKRNKGFHIDKLKGLFEEYKDVDIHRLYTRAYGDMAIGDFLGNPAVSPLAIGMLRSYRLIKAGKIAESVALLSHIKKFVTVNISEIRFESRSQKLFYSTLMKFGVRPAVALLFIRSKVCKG